MNLSWQELIDQGFIVAGSPDSVTSQMERVAETLKVGHIVCLQHIGDMPVEKTRYNTELFAREVMPRLKPIWSEYEDQWSPKPLADDLIAEPRPIRSGAPVAGGD
jgi:hypothetical protein